MYFRISYWWDTCQQSFIKCIFLMITKSNLWGLTHVTLTKDVLISILSIIIQGLTLDIDKTGSDHFSLIRIPMPPYPDSSPFQKNLKWQIFPIIFPANLPFQWVSCIQHISTILHWDNISTISADFPLIVPT